MTPRLIGQNLSCLYRGREVLRDVTVSVPRGRVCVAVGPNGSGKTTLLWAMAGLLKPARGQVLLCEAGASGPEGPEDRPVPVRFPLEGMGMVFQQPALWDHLCAEEHLRLVLAGRGLSRRERAARIDAILARLQLGGLRARRPGQLSGGERQRLAIARAMVIRPQWLLLDEPLSHLDGAAREELLALLRDTLADSHAGVLLSTHDPQDAMRLADEIVVLLRGAVAQSGPAAEVYRRPRSLETALALGPAAQVQGLARNGTLTSDGRVLIEDISPALSGLSTLFLRPGDVQFLPDPSGPAEVRRCEWLGEGYCLTVQVAAVTLLVSSSAPVPPGQTGRLRMRPSQEF